MTPYEAYAVKVMRVATVPGGPAGTSAAAQLYWKSVIERQSWYDADKEHLVALLLDPDLNVQGYSLVSIGSLVETSAHPREIFRAAVASSAYAIVLMHNHPGASATPSNEDNSMTKVCCACGRLLGVPVIDNIIVSGNGTSYSFRENGGLS